MKRETWTDHETETIIGNLLRVGVTISAIVVAIGGVLYLIQNGAAPPHHQQFRGEPESLRTIPGIVRAAFHGNSRGIIQAGLLLLVATPIARVAFSIVAFYRERDRMYIVITLIVLATLLYSLIAHHG